MTVDVVKLMKQSIIDDYFNLVHQFQRGNYKVDTSNIHAKILFVESAVKLDKVHFIYDKLI